MANTASSPAAVIQRLLTLTRQGQIDWEQWGDGSASAFEFQTASTRIILLTGDDHRVMLQIQPAPPRLNQLGELDLDRLFRGPQTVTTVRSDDADDELGYLVRELYEEVAARAARAAGPEDPFGKLDKDLDDAYGSAAP
jgi:hypothetical protein